MTAPTRTLRVGTRGSALALEQTHRVIAQIHDARPDIQCEPHVISTAGDRDKQTSLTILGGQGIFAKELQQALYDDEIDFAVHSVKDLTSELSSGLILGAILQRTDPSDVVISGEGYTLETIPAGKVVGTSSRRRIAQVRALRPDVEIVDLRGNIDTRIRKATDGTVDAAILAAAGVLRMGWHERITQYLPVDDFVPSPGQAALGLECREDNSPIMALLQSINDQDAAEAVRIERAFLRGVGGGCTSPIGAYATIEGDSVQLRAMFASEDMHRIDRRTVSLTRTGAIVEASALALEMKANVDAGGGVVV